MGSGKGPATSSLPGPGQESLSLGPCRDGHSGTPVCSSAPAPAPLPRGLGLATLPDSLQAGLASALEWGERETCLWPSCSARGGLGGPGACPRVPSLGWAGQLGRLIVTDCQEGAGQPWDTARGREAGVRQLCLPRPLVTGRLVSHLGSPHPLLTISIRSPRPLLCS